MMETVVSARRRLGASLWGGRRSVRPLWPADETWPVQGAVPPRVPSVPPGETINDPALCQFMHKRHGVLSDLVAGERAKWGRRYVHIDDTRGRLLYAKRPSQTGDDTAFALSLSDVSSVRALPTFVGGPPHCFEICQAPHKLVLAASDEHECDRWVSCLRNRVEHWKVRADRENGPRAVPNVQRDGRLSRDQHWRIEGCRAAW